MFGGWLSNENLKALRNKYRAWRNFEWYRPGHKKLVGEALREIGCLCLVFIPLEALLKYQPARAPTGIAPALPSYAIWLQYLGISGNNSGTVLIAAFFFIFGLIVLGVGIKVEYDAGRELQELE